ncbi:DMT family transporter [Fluoribacter gormanii]|uniref:EamA domain-containing membrane protein RarD n=1 Tax=Fluoribacter gormanii TaxID=464 RepID=A0A377GNH9_9GAMM|nr:DMT family transporter [Fluoribacter gormanii]KTD00566.1 transmembrane protein [Fluoribacter gormanii]SIR05865.1 EamA domain-containing membrane protein RarD [Fluoribacter gormanii]STO26356.1 putative DMT superfamily transporter inner membrane protein [Fluoribacter gormanii]
MANLFSFLFLGTLGWGISLYLMKILLVSLTPTEIVLYRMAVGAASLFILAKLLKLKTDNIRGLILDGIIVGTFNMTLPFYLTTFAVNTVSSSLASVINGFSPLCTLILGMVFFSSKQKLGVLNLLSIVLGFIGIIIINSDVSIYEGSVVELIALLATALSYGITANYFKYYARTKDPILVSAISAFISAMTMLIFKCATEASINYWGMPQDIPQIIALLWLGVIGSGFCLYLYCSLIQNAGAVFASMITYLMTITGVIMGVVFLHETISPQTMIGCIFIFFSLILVNHASLFEKIFVSISRQIKI